MEAPRVHMIEFEEKRVRELPCRILDRSTSEKVHPKLTSSYRQIGLMCATIFLIALGVRLLHWQDNRQAFPFTGMAEEYKAHAMVLLSGDFKHFLTGPHPPSDANVVKHPLGYPILTAVVFKIFGSSDSALRFVQIILDAVAALLVFFIAAELLPISGAFTAGLLVALSPQLAYHSIALIPDSPVASPLLLALFFLIRAVKRPRFMTIIATGMCIGVSCWLRANALLLAPFIALLLPLLFHRGKRWRYAIALVGAAVLVIAPITIRNIIVFRSFIPLSISAGITMVEGISAYDTEGRFGLPGSDYNVTKWEAQTFNRPDYLGTRFSPDGIKREQWRISRALAVIRAHPFWFLRVMIDRASFMLRLIRTEIVSAAPAVMHSLAIADRMQPAVVIPPALLSNGANSLAQTEFSSATGGPALRITGDAPANFISSPPVNVERNTDYLLRLPLKIEQGSCVVDVIDAQRNTLLTSTSILHPINWLDLTPEQQPVAMIIKPFVSGDASQVRINLRNGSRKAAHVVAEVGRVELFALGPAANMWTHYPRLVIRSVQKLFITALLLPLEIIGAILVWRARCRRAVVILLILSVYYMCTQSALWTEFRYILAMHYPLLVLAAAGLYWAGTKLGQGARQIARWPMRQKQALSPCL